MSLKIRFVLVFLGALFLVSGCGESNSDYEEGFFTEKESSYSFVLIANNEELNKIEEKWTDSTSKQINRLKKDNPNNDYHISVQDDTSYEEIQHLLKKQGMENKEYVILVYELDSVIFNSTSIEDYQKFISNL